MEQVQGVNIDVAGYPEAKEKGVAQVQLLDGQYLLRRMKFQPEPDKNGQPIPAPERVVIDKEGLLKAREALVTQHERALAGIDAIVADIDAAKPL